MRDSERFYSNDKKKDKELEIDSAINREIITERQTYLYRNGEKEN